MLQEETQILAKKLVIRRERRMPVQGEIHVHLDDILSPDTLVASAEVPYRINVIEVHIILGVQPLDAKKYIIKNEGDEVSIDEIIAIRPKSFFHKKKICRAPVNGIIREIRRGRILIQEKRKLEIKAYIPYSKVVEILDKEGVMLETTAIYIQGKFGIGGETYGILKVISESSIDLLTETHITPECKGKIIVGGSLVTLEALNKAVKTSVKGIITGGIDQLTLVKFLNYELGTPVTGDEDIGITLIITEGFGKKPMNEKLFKLLQSSSGKEACINGTTQIRLRKIKPEIIIPLGI